MCISKICPFPYQTTENPHEIQHTFNHCFFFVLADLKRICETEKGSLEIMNDNVRQMLRENGLATQCIQADNAITCKDMTLAQLCLKINSKMGGTNNAIVSNAITRLVSLL